MARRRRRRHHHHARESNPLNKVDIIPIAIGVVGGGLAVYLWMQAQLASANASNNQLAAASGSTGTTGGTTTAS